jgi:hypothetical protein
MTPKRLVLYYFHGNDRTPRFQNNCTSGSQQCPTKYSYKPEFIKIVRSALTFGTGAKIKSLLNYVHATGHKKIYDMETALDLETNGFCPYLTESLAPQQTVMFCGCECFRFPQ